MEKDAIGNKNSKHRISKGHRIGSRRRYKKCSRKKIQIYCLARESFWPLKFQFIFSTNEDDLCHSTRMTFPGSIKGRANALSHLFPTHSSSRTDQHQHEESTFNFWTIVFSRRLFLFHLFIPSRPTGPRSFKLDA